MRGKSERGGLWHDTFLSERRLNQSLHSTPGLVRQGRRSPQHRGRPEPTVPCTVQVPPGSLPKAHFSPRGGHLGPYRSSSKSFPIPHPRCLLCNQQ